ncbi:hypothetical protein APHAL10511_000415 [Amanita phalloides]|nr:hypothetical protein APHAL10511_000415 [Amanita phalloides]
MYQIGESHCDTSRESARPLNKLLPRPSNFDHRSGSDEHMSSPSPEGHRPDDEELHGRVSHLKIDCFQEASVILWKIWESVFPMYFTLRACTDALKEKGSPLYRELKACHSRKEYDTIRNWAFRCIPCNAQPPRLEDTLSAFLVTIKPNITLLVKGELNFSNWTPPESLTSRLDDRTISHLMNLRLPCLRENPNVLLHDLGYFAREPDLQKRVHNVFMPKTPSHTILVNTSGSGKTRLLLEGLCQNWGLYFTSSVDSSHLGSHDIEQTIQTTIPNDPGFCATLPSPTKPDYQSKLAHNEKLAGRVFKRVFLARLLIFDLFIATMHKVRVGNSNLPMDEFKRRWLLLQIQPSILPASFDVFANLTHILLAHSDVSVDMKIREMLGCIRNALSPSCGSSTPTPTSGRMPLYCIIDEAQFAATKHTSAFRSSHPNDAIPRPVLRPLIQTISALTVGQRVFLIIAGTGLSQSTVDATVASAVMKESRYRWCSDIGSFGGWCGMSTWVRRFVPDWVFNGSRGERLKERMGYWLNGRHRFAAGYVTELLAHGFRQPHRLLNAYIQQFTGFDPTDGHTAILEEEEEESLESLSLETRYKLDFSELANNYDMMSTIRHLISHYIMRSVLPGPLGKDEALYVEYGFARFKCSDGESSWSSKSKTRQVSTFAALDEPLVLIAAHRWIEDSEKYTTNYKYLTRHITTHCPSSTSPSNGFENFIVHCIDLVFAKNSPKIMDFFTFHGPAPPWAKLQAELVSIYILPESSVVGTVTGIEHAAVKHAHFAGPSASIGTDAKTPNSTLEWLAHGSRVPFCFPCRAMGPDIIFVLRLSNDKLLWVALQAKLCFSRIDRERVKKAVRSVTPKNFFLDKDGNPFSPRSHPNLVQDTLSRLEALPNRCEGAGKYSLLRAVVSFPARADLGRCINKTDADAITDLEDAQDGHPIAILNMHLVKEVTKGISPVNFLDSLERGKSGKSGKSGKRLVTLKRKPSSSAIGSGAKPRKRRKINLN